MLSDYYFFGQVFRWSPGDVNELGWSVRKQLKQAHIDHQNESK